MSEDMDCVRHAETGAFKTAALDDIRDVFPVRPKLHAQPEDKKTRALDETRRAGALAAVFRPNTTTSACRTESARYDPHVEFTKCVLSLGRVALGELVRDPCVVEARLDERRDRKSEYTVASIQFYYTVLSSTALYTTSL